MDLLDRLATDLRERLLAGAGEGEPDLPGRIRALVDREAGVLSEERRVALVPRGGAAGLGAGRSRGGRPLGGTAGRVGRADRPAGLRAGAAGAVAGRSVGRRDHGLGDL